MVRGGVVRKVGFDEKTLKWLGQMHGLGVREDGAVMAKGASSWVSGLEEVFLLDGAFGDVSSRRHARGRLGFAAEKERFTWAQALDLSSSGSPSISRAVAAAAAESQTGRGPEIFKSHSPLVASVLHKAQNSSFSC
jgi:hypothetical protein